MVRAAGAGRTLGVGGWDCGLGVACWEGCDAKVWWENRDDVSGCFEREEFVSVMEEHSEFSDLNLFVGYHELRCFGS